MYKTVQNELQLKQTPTMESCFRINAGGRQSLLMRSHIDRTVTGDTLLHSLRSLLVCLGYFPYYTSILSLRKDFKCKTFSNAVFLMCGISILTDVNVLSTFLQHCKTPIYFSLNLWSNPSRCTNSVHCSFTSGVWGRHDSVCTLPLKPALVGLNLVRIKAPETQITTIPMLQRSQRLSLQCNSVTQHITDCF